MKLNLLILLLPVVPLFFVVPTYSQDNHELEHEHSDAFNEIGAAIGPVYDISEDNFGVGTHLHYTRMMKGKCKNIGVGGGLEALFAEHNHYNLSAMVVYRPVHPLWFSLGPGITYFAHENEYSFSVHIETGYEFEVGPIHVGPMIEYAYAGGDQHVMIGIHVGFPF